MIVFPAIDLKNGQVVRLSEGDMDRATIYGDDPAAQAMIFADAGAEHLHVVDLDGSFAGESRNRAAVEAIVAAFPGYVQLGGGIRDAAAVEGWFNLGVARVVMGSAALKNPEFVKDMAREFPGGIGGFFIDNAANFAKLFHQVFLVLQTIGECLVHKKSEQFGQ